MSGDPVPARALLQGGLQGWAQQEVAAGDRWGSRPGWTCEGNHWENLLLTWNWNLIANWEKYIRQYKINLNKKLKRRQSWDSGKG